MHSKCKGGDASYFPQAWTLSEECPEAGPHKHHKAFGTQVQLIALPGHLSTGKENRFLCWLEENNEHRAFLLNHRFLNFKIFN